MFWGCCEFCNNPYIIFVPDIWIIHLINYLKMEKKSFKEANIEDIVKSLIELTNRMKFLSPAKSEVPLDYNPEWDVIIGVRRKEIES